MVVTHPENIWLRRFARLVAAVTFVLVIAGASVTSTGSGLAVPDWPLSYGTLFPRMVGGVVFEHGHRMIAGVVLVLTVVLTAWLFRREERSWVRKLGFVALAALVTQALLGGLTVLLKLPDAISVGHAGLAMAFFGLIVSLALVTSAGWGALSPGASEQGRLSTLRKLGLVTTCAIYAQIVLGAVMRHTGAGLAIPDFPLSFGRLIPPYFPTPVAIHYAHRLGALAVSVLVTILVVHVVRRHRDQKSLVRPAWLLSAVLVAQWVLGALTIWMRRAVVPTTAHVAVGAAVFAISLVLTLRAARLYRLSRAVGEGSPQTLAPLRSASGLRPAILARSRERVRGEPSPTARERQGRPASVMASLGNHVELTKPRIILMVILTTLAGFYLGADRSLVFPLVIHAVLGTALVVGSANSLNQLLEREADGMMRRTQGRPLPSGRMSPGEALVSGAGLGVVGVGYLWLAVNALAAALALVAWLNYVFVYTPLKKKSSLSTLVGAVSGALPPVIGWAAARDAMTIESVVLFGILFLWQLPHFLAIAWMYREDYARAGFPMLPVLDPEGIRTGRQIVVYGLALVPVSLMPTLLGFAGAVYFFGALALGLLFLLFGVRAAFRRSNLCARHLFLASLAFLPSLLALMILDRGGV
jgi:protoheme IX farnesyltransferase